MEGRFKSLLHSELHNGDRPVRIPETPDQRPHTREKERDNRTMHGQIPPRHPREVDTNWRQGSPPKPTRPVWSSNPKHSLEHSTPQFAPRNPWGAAGSLNA